MSSNGGNHEPRVLKRRVERLDAVSTGLNPSAVVAQIARKYEVSEGVLNPPDRWMRLKVLKKSCKFRGMGGSGCGF